MFNPMRKNRQSKPSSLSLLENLETRLLMHDAAPAPVYPLGTIVPWLFAPITPATSPPPVSPPPVSPPPSPPPPPPGTVVGSVTGLVLVNATSDSDIGAFSSGTNLDVSTGATFSVRADVGGGTVASVKFLLDGVAIRTENTAPYTVAGDNAGDYTAWSVAAGNHTLAVIPYDGANASGDAGSEVDVAFSVTGTPPSPPASSSFTQISWKTKTSGPLGKAEALTAKFGTRIYVFGGFAGSAGPVTDSEYYDAATDHWTHITKLPQPITHAGVTQDANSVYFVGGYVSKGDGTGYAQTFGSTKVWRYDFATDTYAALHDLPRALAGGGAELIGRKLHYFGGFELNRTDSAVHLVLDLDNPSAGWQAAASMTRTVNHMGHAVIDGRIYTFAGQTGTDEGLVTRNYVSVYDPATNQWSTRAPIPDAISHISSATFIMGDRVIVMGGESAHNVPVRDAWAYTPATDSWAALTLLPAPRFSGVANTVNGKIYFLTGGSTATVFEGTPVG
jgi:N-acetylneuraminic acid mutarotase